MTFVQPEPLIAGVTPISKLLSKSDGRLFWYDGVVQEVKGGRCTVLYDDGVVEVLNAFEAGSGTIHFRALNSVQLVEIAFDELAEILGAAKNMERSVLEDCVARWADEIKDAVLWDIHWKSIPC